TILLNLFLFLLQTPLPPRSTLFPYTTLFRSAGKTPSATIFNRSLVITVEEAQISSGFRSGTDSLEERHGCEVARAQSGHAMAVADRKSTRLNSSHVANSYAVFCLKKKTAVHP